MTIVAMTGHQRICPSPLVDESVAHDHLAKRQSELFHSHPNFPGPRRLSAVAPGVVGSRHTFWRGHHYDREKMP